MGNMDGQAHPNVAVQPGSECVQRCGCSAECCQRLMGGGGQIVSAPTKQEGACRASVHMQGLCDLAWCRRENGSLHDPPMETSFGHWNTLLLSQDENPIIGRIFAGNPNIWFFRCHQNRDVISSLNPPNSHDPNGGTYVRIGGLLKEKGLFSCRLPT